MKLWISGEIEADIGDVFRQTMNEIEALVNNNVLNRDYGNGINAWDVIMIITSEGGKESFKYNTKTRETDIRMVINYDDFKSANKSKMRLLFLDQLLRSIHVLRKMDIKNVYWSELIDNLNGLKKNYIS